MRRNLVIQGWSVKVYKLNGYPQIPGLHDKDLENGFERVGKAPLNSKTANWVMCFESVQSAQSADSDLVSPSQAISGDTTMLTLCVNSNKALR